MWRPLLLAAVTVAIAPATTFAAAPVTALVIDGDPGVTQDGTPEPVTGGKVVNAIAPGVAVDILDRSPSLVRVATGDFRLTIAAPAGRTLSVGRYLHPLAYPLTGAAPAVDLSSAEGCSLSSGVLVIRQMEVTDGRVASFAASLDLHCSSELGIHVEVRVDSDVPFAALDVPTDAIDLGTAAAGVELDRDVTIRNVGTLPLELTPALLETPGVGFRLIDRCRGRALQPGASCVVTIRFRALGVGANGVFLPLITGRPARRVGLAAAGQYSELRNFSEATAAAVSTLPTTIAETTGGEAWFTVRPVADQVLHLGLGGVPGQGVTVWQGSTAGPVVALDDELVGRSVWAKRGSRWNGPGSLGADVAFAAVAGETYTIRVRGHTVWLDLDGDVSTVAAMTDSPVVSAVEAGTIRKTTTLYPYRDGWADAIDVITYALAPVVATASVRNAAGRVVVAVRGYPCTPVSCSFAWDGTLDTGKPAAAGVYTLRLTYIDAGQQVPRVVVQDLAVSRARLRWRQFSPIQKGVAISYPGGPISHTGSRYPGGVVLSTIEPLNPYCYGIWIFRGPKSAVGLFDGLTVRMHGRLKRGGALLQTVNGWTNARSGERWTTVRLPASLWAGAPRVWVKVSTDGVYDLDRLTVRYRYAVLA